MLFVLACLSKQQPSRWPIPLQVRKAILKCSLTWIYSTGPIECLLKPTSSLDADICARSPLNHRRTWTQWSSPKIWYRRKRSSNLRNEQHRSVVALEKETITKDPGKANFLGADVLQDLRIESEDLQSKSAKLSTETLLDGFTIRVTY